MPPRSLFKSSIYRALLQLLLLLCLSLLFTSGFPHTTIAQFDDDVVIPESVVTFQVRLEPEKPRPGEHARIIVDLQIHPESGWHVFSVIPGEDDFAPIPT